MTRRLIAPSSRPPSSPSMLAAAAPRAEAMSFVDKQVEAGALLVQKYINDYGQTNRFVYPPVAMVKQGGKLPGSTFIWPSNPWTGKVMGPGTARGTYTYKLTGSGSGYVLTVHLSGSNQKLTGGTPAWFKPERDTQCKQNLVPAAAIRRGVRDEPRCLVSDRGPGQLRDLRPAGLRVARQSHGPETP